MNDMLVRRVKNSLNMQHYTMNDSWLTDCIEYYLNDHQNATQEEIITFVMNQWVLYDLREINNENGCLPKDLPQKKCTTLSGKYILQMDKMYDISTSKYKQLEKIRNVSSENVEATENENKEEKFQNYEPKAKRMLQLFLTDGVQDILAIEYKPIRFLKDDLYPGFKLMIKGPVICRKGVILLEESNIAEIGGEVDSLLITNALENVLARALNLEENPDPYHDTKQGQKSNTQNTQQTDQLDDDFDMDSEMIDQIDKQIQQQNSNEKKNSTLKSSQKSTTVNTNNSKTQNTYTYDRVQNSNVSVARNQQNLSNTNKNGKVEKQNYSSNTAKRKNSFEDDGDSIIEMIDDNTFTNTPIIKPTFAVPQSATNKPPASSTLIQNQNLDDFPIDDEIYDLTEDCYPVSTKLKSESLSEKNLFDKPSCSNLKTNSQNSNSQNMKNLSSKSQISNNNFNIPDDDFDLADVNMDTDDFNDYFNKNKKSETNIKSSQSTKTITSVNTDNLYRQSTSSRSSENSSDFYNPVQKITSEFEDDIDFEAVTDFKNVEKIQQEIEKFRGISSIKSEKKSQENITEMVGVKRTGSAMSPISEKIPQKVRCLQSSPKTVKGNERKITDFLKKPESLISANGPNSYELLKDVLRQPLTDEGIQTAVRGKVIKIIKLNLLKNENGPYFHLEGAITDNTANLEVVFSSEVLEKIIGYSPQEFSQKRKQSKVNPSIKDQLREDLKKAQQTLTVMDELMEIELKKDRKALILNFVKLSKQQRKAIDDRIKALNM